MLARGEVNAHRLLSHRLFPCLQVLAREQEFLAIVFHELRNPVSGAVGHLRLASSELDGQQDMVQMREHIHGALTSIDHAMNFLQSLNQLQKLEALQDSADSALSLQVPRLGVPQIFSTRAHRHARIRAHLRACTCVR